MSIDISTATVDVIEAVKNNKTIKFDYQTPEKLMWRLDDD